MEIVVARHILSVSILLGLSVTFLLGFLGGVIYCAMTKLYSSDRETAKVILKEEGGINIKWLFFHSSIGGAIAIMLQLQFQELLYFQALLAGCYWFELIPAARKVLEIQLNKQQT